MKATITRPDGSRVDFEGLSGDVMRAVRDLTEAPGILGAIDRAAQAQRGAVGSERCGRCFGIGNHGEGCPSSPSVGAQVGTIGGFDIKRELARRAHHPFCPVDVSRRGEWMSLTLPQCGCESFRGEG